MHVRGIWGRCAPSGVRTFWNFWMQFMWFGAYFLPPQELEHFEISECNSCDLVHTFCLHFPFQILCWQLRHRHLQYLFFVACRCLHLPTQTCSFFSLYKNTMTYSNFELKILIKQINSLRNSAIQSKQIIPNLTQNTARSLSRNNDFC